MIIIGSKEEFKGDQRRQNIYMEYINKNKPTNFDMEIIKDEEDEFIILYDNKKIDKNHIESEYANGMIRFANMDMEDYLKL